MHIISDELFDNDIPIDTDVALIDDTGQLTFAELRDRVTSLAATLQDKGVTKGDRVAVICPNRNEYVIAYYAITLIGAIYVPLNWRLLAAEHVTLMNNAEPTVLLADSSFVESIELAATDVPSLEGRIAVIGGTVGEYDTFDSWSHTGAQPTSVDVTPEDPATIVYTSGTTAAPKGVLLTHDNIVFDRRSVAKYSAPRRGDASLHVSPLYHQTSVHTFVHLAAGATVRLISKFDPLTFFEAVAELHATYTFLAPTMLYKLLDDPRIGRYDLSTLRRIGYGAAPITGARLKEALEVFGPILVHAYGLSEATSHVSYLSAEDHLVAEGSIGRGVEDIDVKVIDIATGEPVEPGSNQVGEILVRGRTTMKGYWNETELTSETIVDDWLYSGDMATVDSRGYLYVVDRKKDLVISGGVNIYPRDIENVLAKHPKVAEVAVIGIPDDYWGEALMAVLVHRPGTTLTAAEIEEYCRSHLGGYQVPKHIRFQEDLPRNLSGKILKRELRDSVVDSTSR
ncbi:class I adenylate-forming enzyme family protein [Rhodococcus qingshengii]|uniref:class I adenylate-forming enzyme family protein n=1 Tax=Rhodococcus qingshengii TaxID=334542 RepID=UPI001F1329F5|nr:AMP-binding protein [Rhodococcus qingshengii]ULD45117.1 AMP-binding protein [Rhodococcus qingshengii]